MGRNDGIGRVVSDEALSLGFLYYYGLLGLMLEEGTRTIRPPSGTAFFLSN